MSQYVPCQGPLRPGNGSWSRVTPAKPGTHGLAR
jgi:hypothetical protein